MLLSPGFPRDAHDTARIELTDRILDALARLCLRRNKEILIAAARAGACWPCSAPRASPSIPTCSTSSRSRTSRSTSSAKSSKTSARSTTTSCVMDMPKGRDVHDYDSLIDAIAEGYRKNPRIEDVTYKIPNPLDFIEIILPKALLFLSPAELDEVGGETHRRRHPRVGGAQCGHAPDAAGDGHEAARSIRSRSTSCRSSFASFSPPAAASASTPRAATTCRPITACC